MQLPSRGQVMVTGTFNDVKFTTPLEPDGNWSHWFTPDAKLLSAAQVKVGDTVTLMIEVTKNWPEPNLPADLQKAIAADADAEVATKRANGVYK
jgi:hypothetical protein